MNIDKIKEAVNSGLPSSTKRMLILDIISQDESALTDMMEILNIERESKKALLLEMNMQLSRADTVIEHPKIAEKEFILGEIKKFYKDHAGQVSHCFKSEK